jgi:hypothetical protein
MVRTILIFQSTISDLASTQKRSQIHHDFFILAQQVNALPTIFTPILLRLEADYFGTICFIQRSLLNIEKKFKSVATE